jgi:hypothetical protein
MVTIGRTSAAALVRADFSDDETWGQVLAAVLAETQEGFQAYLEVVEEPGLTGLTQHTFGL